MLLVSSHTGYKHSVNSQSAAVLEQSNQLRFHPVMIEQRRTNTSALLQKWHIDLVTQTQSCTVDRAIIEAHYWTFYCRHKTLKWAVSVFMGLRHGGTGEEIHVL